MFHPGLRPIRRRRPRSAKLNVQKRPACPPESIVGTVEMEAIAELVVSTLPVKAPSTTSETPGLPLDSASTRAGTLVSPSIFLEGHVSDAHEDLWQFEESSGTITSTSKSTTSRRKPRNAVVPKRR